MSAVASRSEGVAMSFEFVLGALVSVGLFAYLTFALIRPERF